MAARTAAWVGLALGIYAVIAAATLLGLVTGAGVGAIGLLLSIAVLVERPRGRLRRVARIGFALNAIVVLAGAAVLLVLADWP